MLFSFMSPNSYHTIRNGQLKKGASLSVVAAHKCDPEACKGALGRVLRYRISARLKCQGGRQSGRLDKVQMVPDEHKREDGGCYALR